MCIGFGEVSERQVAAVVLAAGASTRLGELKQLVTLAGKSLLERAVSAAREASCKPVIVVLGAAHGEILAHGALGDAVPVINHEWQEGMASSIRLGMQTLGSIAKDAEGVLLMTCDQPAVTAAHLSRVLAKQEVNASRYAGRNGVPAYFPKKYFGELLSLSGDAGARSLLAQAPFEELQHGELDIDTPEDFARACELFG
jgi:molybdenum cofactor cytidylyltransferase